MSAPVSFFLVFVFDDSAFDFECPAMKVQFFKNVPNCFIQNISPLPELPFIWTQFHLSASTPIEEDFKSEAS